MPTLAVRKVSLGATRSYAAPRGLSRVRMTANPIGVSMLAAVNGRGAYSANRKRTKTWKRRAASFSAKAKTAAARAKRLKTKAAKAKARRQATAYRKKATKARRKVQKRAKKKATKKDVKRFFKRLARGTSMTWKQVRDQLRAAGATNIQKTDDGTVTATVGGQKVSYDIPDLDVSGSSSGRSPSVKGEWDIDLIESYGERLKANKGKTMVKNRKRRRSRRRAKAPAFLRNLGMTPNKRKKKKAKARKKAKKTGGVRGIKKSVLKALGVDVDDPAFASPVVSGLMDRVVGSSMSADEKKKVIQKLAKAYFPKQRGRASVKIPVDVVIDPLTGKTKKVNVRYSGKIQKAYGPYKRRLSKGRLTFEWKKGKKIPDWALVGAPSKAYFDAYGWEFAEVASRLKAVRDNATASRVAAYEKALGKVKKRFYDKDGNLTMDEFTPNRRRRKARKGAAKRRKKTSARRRTRRVGAKRRTVRRRKSSAKRRRRSSGKRKAKRRGRKLVANRRKTRRKARRRGKRPSALQMLALGAALGGGRKRRKSRKGRKGAKRRASSRRRRSSAKRRSRKARRSRKGGRRMRRNGYASNDFVGALKTAFSGVKFVLGGFIAHYAVSRLALSQGAANYLPEAVRPYANLLVSGVVAAAGIAAADKFLTTGAIDVMAGMAMGAMLDLVRTAVAQFVPSLSPYVGVGAYELAGFGSYQNISGWGSRSFGAYEGSNFNQAAAGLGAPLMQAAAGFGSPLMQAAAGLGAPVMQAAAGYGAYELSGLDGMPTLDGLRPEQSDAALDYADSQSLPGNEYVPTAYQYGDSMFQSDPLASMGVPANFGGAVPAESLTIPYSQQSGIFADPNVLPPAGVSCRSPCSVERAPARTHERGSGNPRTIQTSPPDGLRKATAQPS